MIVIPPLSTERGRLYEETLPEPTQELCGEQGIYMGVGFLEGFSYLVYRGTYTTGRDGVGQGRWNWVYSVDN